MNDQWKMSTGEVIVRIIIPLILITGFIIWRLQDTTTTAQIVITGAEEEIFYGKIDSVYRDKWDHDTKKVILSTGYVYALYPQWESKVTIGDSLSKKTRNRYS